MKKILILVEGQTEERFVKNVLDAEFKSKGYFLIPTLVNTKFSRELGTYKKGGWNSYERAKKDLQKLLKDTSVVAVTTMFDFYGLPQDFPSWDKNGDCYAKVESAETAFKNDVNNIKFIPYLQLHEFEALLFSSPKDIVDTLVDQTKLESLLEVKKSFTSPEEINHGPETHPSKRLIKMFEQYNKVVYGTLIAKRTGLINIRSNCKHFDAWITQLLLA